MNKVEVMPHSVDWRDAFEAEAGAVAAALGENTAFIHHIGSTAIPDIFAKPVIDILVEVKDLAAVDASGSAMEALGYEVMGEFGIAGRRYFRRNNKKGIRTHQVHVFEAASAEAERHLRFRDYLIAHPGEAQAYSELKQRLAKTYADSMDDYIDGKDGFIKEIDRKASQWQASQFK